MAHSAKSKRRKINWTLVGTLLAQGLTVSDIAGKVGTTRNTLAVGICKKGLKVSEIRAQTVSSLSPDVTSGLVSRVAKQASELLRETYGDILEKHSRALSDVPVLPDVEHLKKVGEAFEPFVRMAKTVHGWSESGDNKPIVNVAWFGSLEPEEPLDPKQVAESTKLTQISTVDSVNAVIDVEDCTTKEASPAE